MQPRTRRLPQCLALRRLPLFSSLQAPTGWGSLRLISDAANPSFPPSAPDSRPWRRQALRSGQGLLHGRGLATALDDFNHVANTSLSNSSYSLYPPPHSMPLPNPYDPRPFDPSSPLVLPRQTQHDLPRSRSMNGVPGDAELMLPIFDACMQVGKLDRAGSVLKRLSSSSFKEVARPDIMALHNQYLRAALDQLMSSPSASKADEIHKWYELQISRNQLPQTPETIACMLKASLLTPVEGSRLERLVSRYMGMAPGDAGLQVLYQTDILTDLDRAKITDICPTYNLPATLELELESPDPPQDQTTVDTAAAYNFQSPPGPTPTPTPYPEVLSTPQRGFGLEKVKQTLSLFHEIPEGRDIGSLPIDQQREIQARLESDCLEAAVERWREENEALQKMGLNTAMATASLGSITHEWHSALEKRLTLELAKIEQSEATPDKSREDTDRCMYGPFLRQSSPSRLAALTILSILSSMAMHGADRGVPIAIVVRQMAAVTEEDIRVQQRKKEAKTNKRKPRKHVQSSLSNILRVTHGTGSTRQEQGAGGQSPAEGVGGDQGIEGGAVETAPATAGVPIGDLYPQTTGENRWPLSIKMHVGAALLSALLDTARLAVGKEDPETEKFVTELQPAFMRSWQLKKGKRLGMVTPNKALTELMMREPRGNFLARHLPMVCEPEPWTKFEKGGYIISPTPVVRTKPGEKEQKLYSKAAIARSDMEQMLRGLDALGKTPWRINQPVLKVLLQIWNTGESVAGIPALNPSIEIPEEPAASDDPVQRRAWVNSVKAAHNAKSAMHSLRCFMNLQLEIARAFKDQTFYQPHNIDFRGRAYPIPVYLNHMGADHVRGLMLFAKGKELGEEGFRWLKIHLANVYGYDKASLKEREAFAMEHMDEILDSANKPLEGNRWWLKAEDPFQCLATCYELKGAFELADVTKFVSHLPIHQDGTCNGLQHYAALGGDSWGARQVNLEPGDRPADVYSAVADLVNESIDEDRKLGVKMAAALEGKVTRKVVKQTVMTNVYGVTFIGAKKQIKKQLDALYPTLRQETGFDSVALSSYIAVRIFRAMSTMFRGAHDIQSWLGEIGARVCRALSPEQLHIAALEVEAKAAAAAAADSATPKLDRARSKSKPKSKSRSKTKILADIPSQLQSTLIWTTPLRMPVVQPYRKPGLRAIQTCLQTLVLKSAQASDPVNLRKQLQAFPPNFIHSLDASHMMLSALECDRLGLTFAAVHDSFWTHAGDVPKMSRILRDSFIRIHSEDVIGRLAEEFRARYKGSMYLVRIPADSELDKAIRAHRMKAGLSENDELLLEKMRADLLSSSDPKAVAQGKAMVTPGSIYEEFSAAKDLAHETEDVSEFALGKIPAAELKAIQKLQGVASADDPTTATAESGAGQEAVIETGPRVTDAIGMDMDAEMDAEMDMEMDTIGPYHEESVDGLNRTDSANIRRLESEAPATSYFNTVITAPRDRSRSQSKTHIWLPLTLPPIPPKGDFDVKRLKGSQYFFS